MFNNACGPFGVRRVDVTRVNGAGANQQPDDISVEEPLQIGLMLEGGQSSAVKTVAVTMRTPGNDKPLAVGFLFTEGIIRSAADVESVRMEGPNSVTVVLRRGTVVDASLLDRHSFISSSCGACGKRSIAAVRVARRFEIESDTPQVNPELVYSLPEVVRRAQEQFSLTGGIHASALFDPLGELIALQEDVGRHNALDKLIGAELLAGNLPLKDRMLLLSGRVSFELVQKAAIAGIPVIAAVGAPSSLAVELAAECGITLLGFVREQRFNVYHDCGRLVSVASEASQPAEVG